MSLNGIPNLRLRSRQAFFEVRQHVLNRIFDYGMVVFRLSVILALRGCDVARGPNIDVLNALNLDGIVGRNQLQDAENGQIELVKIPSKGVNGASVGHGRSICYVSINNWLDLVIQAVPEFSRAIHMWLLRISNATSPRHDRMVAVPEHTLWGG